jgi:hypothetical protein
MKPIFKEGKVSFLVRSSLKRWMLGLIVLVVVAFVLMPAPQRAAASVILDYFKAEWRGASQTVLVSWKTASELNITGFAVQRSTSASGSYVDITDVIPAVGDQLTGATYGPVADDPLELTLGVTYWYRLVLIRSDASRENISPVAVLVGGKIYLPMIVR